MVTQYLALQRATNLRKPMKINVKAVDSPLVKMDDSCPFASAKLLYNFPKINFTTKFQAQLCS